MADNHDNHAAHLEAHQQTWAGFKSMMVWGTVLSALVGALVVFLIAPK